MAKSARASVLKKNKSGLRKKVFGPVEAARQERLNAKLTELASQPKPPRAEMEVEGDASTEDPTADSKDASSMEVDAKKVIGTETKGSDKPRNTRSSSKIHKTRHRRARNDIVFAPTGKAKANKRSKR